MSGLTSAFKNELCAKFTSRVGHLSLHTADPGATGIHDSTIAHKPVTWTTPTAGVSYGTATFTLTAGAFTHIGLWGTSNTVFLGSVDTEINYSTGVEITVLITHEVSTGSFRAVVDR